MAKQLHRIEIEPAENGGHTVKHHFREIAKDSKSHAGVSMRYHEPESHVFGPEEGHEMLAHIANHLGIKEPDGEREREHEVEEEDGE